MGGSQSCHTLKAQCDNGDEESCKVLQDKCQCFLAHQSKNVVEEVHSSGFHILELHTNSMGIGVLYFMSLCGLLALVFAIYLKCKNRNKRSQQSHQFDRDLFHPDNDRYLQAGQFPSYYNSPLMGIPFQNVPRLSNIRNRPEVARITEIPRETTTNPLCHPPANDHDNQCEGSFEHQQQQSKIIGKHDWKVKDIEKQQ